MAGTTNEGPRDPWLRIGLHQLAALAAVQEDGSILAAAARLDEQPLALSRQIEALERTVGTRLVLDQPGPGRVALTDAGKRLVRHYDRMRARLGAATADLASLQDGSIDIVRAGLMPCATARILPRALALLDERRPDLRVEATQDDDDLELYKRVTAGELDLAVAELPAPPGPFVAWELVRDPCVVIIPPGSELAGRSEVTALEQIAPLALARRPRWRHGELVDAAFRERGLQPHYGFHAKSDWATRSAVAGGLVEAAIMPLLALVEGPDIAVLGTGHLLPPRRLALLWHRDRRASDALEAVRDALFASCAGAT